MPEQQAPEPNGVPRYLLARYTISFMGLLIAVFAVRMNPSIAMLVPAIFISLMCHWMAMDSHWPTGNRLLLGQMLLSFVGLSFYVCWAT